MLVCRFQALGPVRHLRADQLLSLGSLVTEMSERELNDVGSTDPAVLAHLGTLTGWSPKKVRHPADERQPAGVVIIIIIVSFPR